MLIRPRRYAVAGCENHFWGPLSVSALPSGHPMQGRHAFAFGGEGNLVDARESSFQLIHLETGLSGGSHERALRGFAPYAPNLAVPHQARIRGQGGCPEQLLENAGRWHLAAPVHEAPAGPIPRTPDVNHVAGRRDAAHGHFVSCECAGLIGADDRGATQRLHGREMADQSIAPRHLLDPKREGNSDHGRQRLGHNRNAERNSEDQHLHEPGTPCKPRCGDHGNDD